MVGNIIRELSLFPIPRKVLLKNQFCVFNRSLVFEMSSTDLTLNTHSFQSKFKLLRLLASDLKKEILSSNSNSVLTIKLDVDQSYIKQIQGYRISINQDEILIIGQSEKGLFYGLLTLIQIIEQSKGNIPCLEIEDWPDFVHRGVMLDVSRNKVPLMTTLFSIIDMLSNWKINQLQLYTEHTFAYSKYPEVWENASPLTAEEIQKLDQYCKDRFIDLVPNQNSFGHMIPWLTKWENRHLAEEPARTTPSSLCPIDPKSIEFLDGLYEELLPNFSSNYFHVGCDEVHLGSGRSEQECSQLGIGNVYMNFLKKIHNLVEKHGKIMQFWGDEIIKFPELLKQVPLNSVVMEWGYEADHPFGENLEKYKTADLPVYVCPGTSSWNSVTGLADKGIANIRNAAEAGLKFQSEGFLNTDWGDNGHWQPLPVSFLGYMYGAGVSWGVEENKNIDIIKNLNIHAFCDSNNVMGELVMDLGLVYKNITSKTSSNSFIMENSFIANLLIRHPNREKDLMNIEPSDLKDVDIKINKLISDIDQSSMKRSDSQLIIQEYKMASSLLSHACRLGTELLPCIGKTVPTSSFQEVIELYRMQMYSPDIRMEIFNIPRVKRKLLYEDLTAIIKQFKDCWVARNRIGGLNRSIGKFNQLLAWYLQ